MKRTSDWREYMASKEYIELIAEDKTQELVDTFDKIVNQYIQA